MRSVLSDFDWYVYGPSVHDLDYIVKIVQNIIADRKAKLDADILADPDIDPEALSDVMYYAWIEHAELWTFALWRLQAIFEGVLDRNFLGESKKKRGLGNRLGEMRARGFSLSGDEQQELLGWAKLRNALSHSPPEQYRPASLTEDDIIQYKALLTQIIGRWESEIPH